MSAAPLPLALAEVLARGDIWRGDTLASLPEKPCRAVILNWMKNCRAVAGHAEI